MVPSFQPTTKMDQQRVANWIHALRRMAFVTGWLPVSLFARDDTASSMAVISLEVSKGVAGVERFSLAPLLGTGAANSWGTGDAGEAMTNSRA